MKLISIAEYAKKHNKNPTTVRQKARNGDFNTAQKIGRDWFINADEPYPQDKRITSGAYKDWRKIKSEGKHKNK